jgi:hypothetical protein
LAFLNRFAKLSEQPNNILKQNFRLRSVAFEFSRSKKSKINFHIHFKKSNQIPTHIKHKSKPFASGCRTKPKRANQNRNVTKSVLPGSARIIEEAPMKWNRPSELHSNLSPQKTLP